jgi:hypothetical protein
VSVVTADALAAHLVRADLTGVVRDVLEPAHVSLWTARRAGSPSHPVPNAPAPAGQ